MDELVGKCGEFWQPLAGKGAVGVVFQRIAHRIIYAYDMHAGSTCLHLKLGVVDAGFIVQEKLGKVTCAVFPMLEEVVGQEGDEHGAHPEIDPARVMEAAHTGVNDRDAGVAGFPGFEGCAIIMERKLFVSGLSALVLEGGVDFEFLNEMAVPVQPGEKLLVRSALGHVIQGLAGGVIYLTNGDIAPCEVG